MAKRQAKKEKIEEVIEVLEEAPMTASKSKPKKKQYWANHTYIRGIGIVKGEVNPQHLARFKAMVPKETDINNWLSDHDRLEKKMAEARRKQGEKIK